MATQSFRLLIILVCNPRISTVTLLMFNASVDGHCEGVIVHPNSRVSLVATKGSPLETKRSHTYKKFLIDDIG